MPGIIIALAVSFLRTAGARGVVGQLDNFQRRHDFELAKWWCRQRHRTGEHLHGRTARHRRSLPADVSDASGAGGKLTVFNRDQWLGDYFDQGITTIEVDLRNEGTVALSIRIAFKTGPGATGVGGFLSQPMLLPAGSGWQHFSISLAPNALIPINNPGPWSSFFIGEVRFIHEVGATNLTGDNVVGRLGHRQHPRRT
jgi:hypothetical protein